MRQEYSNSVMQLMEEVMTSGADEMGSVFAEIMNLAMRIERERFLNAKPFTSVAPSGRAFRMEQRAKNSILQQGQSPCKCPKRAGMKRHSIRHLWSGVSALCEQSCLPSPRCT